LSVSSEFALLGVLFVDLLVTDQVHWAIAAPLMVTGRVILGSIHGFLVARMRDAAFRRDRAACSSVRLLRTS
jgi:ribose transport system permease protein